MVSFVVPPPRPGSAPIRTRRLPRCPGCALPPPLCLCDELPAIAVRTRVIVLMHRAELTKSTSTGRLLARMIPSAEVRVRGEPGPPPPPLPEGRRLLLYPEPGAREVAPGMADGAPPLLLVPDGTWGQARRIVQRDPAARSAEPVRLPPGAPSCYGLRRNAREGTVSTFEAVARALGLLEGAAIEAQLMDGFHRFVERSLLVRRHGETLGAERAPAG